MFDTSLSAFHARNKVSDLGSIERSHCKKEFSELHFCERRERTSLRYFKLEVQKSRSPPQKSKSGNYISCLLLKSRMTDHSEEDLTCRICFERGSNDRELLHPCKCSGSMKFVHQECLLHWLKTSQLEEKSCNLCNHTFRYKKKYGFGMKRKPVSSELIKHTVSTWNNTLMFLIFAALSFCVLPWFCFWRLRVELWANFAPAKSPAPHLLPISYTEGFYRWLGGCAFLVSGYFTGQLLIIICHTNLQVRKYFLCTLSSEL